MNWHRLEKINKNVHNKNAFRNKYSAGTQLEKENECRPFDSVNINKKQINVLRHSRVKNLIYDTTNSFVVLSNVSAFVPNSIEIIFYHFLPFFTFIL